MSFPPSDPNRKTFLWAKSAVGFSGTDWTCRRMKTFCPRKGGWRKADKRLSVWFSSVWEHISNPVAPPVDHSSSVHRKQQSFLRTPSDDSDTKESSMTTCLCWPSICRKSLSVVTVTALAPASRELRLPGFGGFVSASGVAEALQRIPARVVLLAESKSRETRDMRRKRRTAEKHSEWNTKAAFFRRCGPKIVWTELARRACKVALPYGVYFFFLNQNIVWN